MKTASQIMIAISFIAVLATCKQVKKIEITQEVVKIDKPYFQLSLAQWSMHRMIREGGVDPYSFAQKAKGWGFTGLEYVSQLYDDELSKTNFSTKAMAVFVEKSNAEAKKHNMQNVLIMVDHQGDLAVTDNKTRQEAVENHFKWVDAAAAMGCHAIRVNAAGSDVPDQWKKNAVDGLTKLATYAKTKNINVIVENHGGLSSNGAMLARVMEIINMDNCGTLPDFGNFCITKNSDASCANMYNRYKGVTELMPHAKAVSAKSYNFDAAGNETEINYTKMLQIVKGSGYKGFIGVEYEGDILGEEAGILATKELILKVTK